MEIKRLDKLIKLFLLNSIKLYDNIILSGKLWTIISIDIKRDKVYVEKASNAKPPKYFGGGVKLHSRILEKIMELLCNSKEFNYLNETALNLLNELRNPYKTYKVCANERIIWQSNNDMIFETFVGTRIFRTLVWMLKAMGVEVEVYDELGRIKVAGIYPLDKILEEIKNKEWTREELFEVTKENEWFRSKYLEYIPKELQFDMYATSEIDINGALKFLKEYKIRIIND